MLEAAIYQLDFDEDVGEFVDTTWGELDVRYATIPDVSVLYLNLLYGSEWAIHNVPIRGDGFIGEDYAISVAFDLGVMDGTAIVDPVSYGVSITESPIGSPPEPDGEVVPMDKGVRIRTGFSGEFAYYTTIEDPIWFLSEDYTEAAFHPWDKIVNKDCELYECFAVGVSNSLELLKALHPDEMAMVPDSELTTSSVRQHTGWNQPIMMMGETIPGGSPGGVPDNPMAAWNRKKAWCDMDPNLPISTEIINEKNDIHRMLEAIQNGCDVELVTHFHAVMVTGVIIRADGTYVIEVVDDSKQGEAGGTRVSLIEYDPATGMFSGQEWVQDEIFKSAAENDRPLFMIECVM